MPNRFSELTFTPSVKEVQREQGSARQYDRMQEFGPENSVLGSAEAEFVAARDSFYMATVSETGWPYVQHRGGPKGFLQVLDERRLAFPDFRGNRQYISVGNAIKNDRVALFLMDYPNQARLKILGHLSEEEISAYPQLKLPGYRAVPERALVVQVEAFDWNCPQHITPRYTVDELAAAGFVRQGGDKRM
jgi:predicted pyridoxine 5'-phosphate oxidase superfamily flavin-nucleotide-binding protein